MASNPGQRIVYGNRDLTRVLIEESGYVGVNLAIAETSVLIPAQYVDIGPGPNSHTWGAVLLSKASFVITVIAERLKPPSVSNYKYNSPLAAVSPWGVGSGNRSLSGRIWYRGASCNCTQWTG